MDRPTLVTNEQLRGVATATAGVTRFEAFADQHVWIGRVVNSAHQASGWHVHPGRDTYAHCTRGRFFLEFGPGMSERIEIAPGTSPSSGRGPSAERGTPVRRRTTGSSSAWVRGR